jgi:hypothetical protein
VPRARVAFRCAIQSAHFAKATAPAYLTGQANRFIVDNAERLVGRGAQMAEKIKTGTVLIKDGALLPDALQFETEPCAKGWRLVKNLDACALGQKVRETGWIFFCVAGQIKRSIVGFDGQAAARRAVKRILTNLKLDKFNGLEITQIEMKRFLGLPYVTVCAHSRHIQENVFLLRANDHQDWDQAKLASV